MLELHTWLASNGFTLFDVAIARDKLIEDNELDSCDMLIGFVHQQSAAMGSSLLNALFHAVSTGDKNKVESTVVSHINRVCQGFSNEVQKSPHLKAVSTLRQLAFDLNCWLTNARTGMNKIVENLEAHDIDEKFNVVHLQMEHCLKQFKMLWAPLQKLKAISDEIYGYDDSFVHINESILTLGMAIQCISLSMSLVEQAEEARNRDDGPSRFFDDEEESDDDDEDESDDDDDDDEEESDEEESDEEESDEEESDEADEEEEEPRRKPPRTVSMTEFAHGPWVAGATGQHATIRDFRVRIVRNGIYYRFMVNTHVNTNDYPTDQLVKQAALNYINSRLRSKK